MKVIGIDLSGPRNVADTCMVIFDQQLGELHFTQQLAGIYDLDILESVSGLGSGERIVIGIDAPLSYEPRGGNRESDRELHQRMRDKGSRSVMPPMAPQMVYLTLHGIALTRMLETLYPRIQLEIVEVHPGACMLLRDAPPEDVRNFKKDAAARLRLCEWLSTKGLKGLPARDKASDHFVAACGAALGTWGWAQGKSIWRFPASPPEHPYDFVC
jgi:predicted nuclease with RNAse H fold